MKVLLLTVAGLSTRFSKSLEYECLKCIYYRNAIEESLLYQMLSRHSYFSKIIIVGGYKYKELEDFILVNFKDISEKIILVENKFYAEYGSGYSLYLGLKAIEDIHFDELVFAEGDLFVDEKGFKEVCRYDGNVLTYNHDPILANKSVAFYFDLHGTVHYIYDTAHGTLEIPEPFSAIYNSGQVWKFSEPECLKKVIKTLKPEDFEGTNLVLINAYFASARYHHTGMIGFDKWINCNTVDDFNRIGGTI